MIRSELQLAGSAKTRTGFPMALFQFYSVHAAFEQKNNLVWLQGSLPLFALVFPSTGVMITSSSKELGN